MAMYKHMKHNNSTVPKHNKSKFEWADKFVGTPMPSKVKTGEKSKCTNWYKCNSGSGAWFVLEDGSRVYKEFPSVKGARD